MIAEGARRVTIQGRAEQTQTASLLERRGDSFSFSAEPLWLFDLLAGTSSCLILLFVPGCVVRNAQRDVRALAASLNRDLGRPLYSAATTYIARRADIHSP
jgi:hypothetical protein